MTRKSATLIGWALIAAIAGFCFVLNGLRFQHLHFNLFVGFTILAGVVLVLSVAWLESKAERGKPEKKTGFK